MDSCKPECRQEESSIEFWLTIMLAQGTMARLQSKADYIRNIERDT